MRTEYGRRALGVISGGCTGEGTVKELDENEMRAPIVEES